MIWLESYVLDHKEKSMDKFRVEITNLEDSDQDYMIETYRDDKYQGCLLLDNKEEMDLLVDAIEKERWESGADLAMRKCEYELHQHIPPNIDIAELERMGKRLHSILDKRIAEIALVKANLASMAFNKEN